MDDILTINKLAPCFRKDGCQLMFASLTAMKGGLTDGNYREIARVGVKRVKLDGSDAVAGGNFKPLTYRQFMKVFKRMQAEADVALQAQMAQRGWVEPDRAAAQRVLMDDGTIVSIEEARKTGCLGRPAAAGAPHPPIALVRPPLARAPAAGEPGPAAVSGGSAESGPALAGSEAEEAAAEALSSIVHAMTEAVGLGQEELCAQESDVHVLPQPSLHGSAVGAAAAGAEAGAGAGEAAAADTPGPLAAVEMSVSADGRVEVAVTSVAAASLRARTSAGVADAAPAGTGACRGEEGAHRELQGAEAGDGGETGAGVGGLEQAMGGRHFVSHPLCPAHQDVRDGFPVPIPHTVTEVPMAARSRRCARFQRVTPAFHLPRVHASVMVDVGGGQLHAMDCTQIHPTHRHWRPALVQVSAGRQCLRVGWICVQSMAVPRVL